MQVKLITLHNDQAAYIISDAVLIRVEQDVLDLIGETSTQSIILHDYNFEKDFFDISTRKLGAILQKFTNFRIRLAVIGDFSQYSSKILPQFIAESNRRKEYIFVNSLAEVKKIWGE